MAEREHSPLGKVVRRHRERLGITQQDLVDRLNRRPDVEGSFTLRTVQEWERRYPPDVTWRVPHRANLRSLAAALDIEPDTAAWQELQHAARSRRLVATTTNTVVDASRDAVDAFIGAGREQPLELLQLMIDRACAGMPSVAFIGADLGTGKTWLTAQAARDSLERHPDMVVLWGESLPNADPQHALRQILLQLIGEGGPADQRHLTDSANQRRRAERMNHGVETILAHRQGIIDRFIPLEQFANLANAPELPFELRQRIAEAAAAGYPGPGAFGPGELLSQVLIEYVTHPTLLVLEDIHWADVGTAAILHHLLTDLAGTHSPLTIICTYRPAELTTDEGLAPSAMARVMREASRLISAARIDLTNAVGGDNGRAFVDAYVSAVVREAPIALNESLFAATAGLPLLVSRLVRWYRDEGALRDVESGNQLTWHHAPRPLPGDVTDVIQSLLDRVPVDLRRVLDLAAVQGMTFSAEAIGDILELSPAELVYQLDTQLDDRHRLITAAGVSVTAGVRSHDYAFVHALFRDELYQRLSPFERDHLHLQTAAALAKRWGATPHDGCARIALHYRMAEDLVQAGTWYLRGGDYWLERHQYDPARAMFADIQTFDLRLTAPLLTAQSLVGLGNCNRGDGDAADARRCFTEAQEIARRERLPLVQANALTSEAMLDFDAGQMQRGIDLLRKSIDLLIEFGDLQEACRSTTLLSHALHGAGRYAEAAERAREAIALAVSLPNELLEASAQIALGNCLLDLGRYDDASARYEECLEICGRHQSMHRAVICWLNISLCALEQGQWERARASLNLVFGSGAKTNPRLIGAGHFNRAMVAELTGDPEAAEQDYAASLAIRQAFDQHALQIDSRGGLVRIAQHRGDPETMARELEIIEAHLDGSGIDGIEHPGRLHLTLVDAYGVLRDPDRQGTALRRGMDMLEHRADLLSDEDSRRIYLTQVPSHQALLEHARARQQQPARASSTQEGNSRAGDEVFACGGELA